MSAQQELISAVRSMQSNAQANLPVIPNNGNPNGAYNAPRQGTVAPIPKSNGIDLSWLQQSPAMQQFQQSLAQRQPYIDGMLAQLRQQPAPPMAEPTIPAEHPAMQTQQMPTLPRPQSHTGIVLPSTGMNTGIIPRAGVPTNVAMPLPFKAM